MVAQRGCIANLSMHSLTVQDLRAGSKERLSFQPKFFVPAQKKKIPARSSVRFGKFSIVRTYGIYNCCYDIQTYIHWHCMVSKYYGISTQIVRECKNVA